MTGRAHIGARRGGMVRASGASGAGIAPDGPCGASASAFRGRPGPFRHDAPQGERDGKPGASVPIEGTEHGGTCTIISTAPQ